MTKLSEKMENAIPVSDSHLKQLDKDGVEYEVINKPTPLSNYTWIKIIPTAKSFLGLFHAGIHVGLQFNERRAA